MSIEENKALVRRWQEVFNTGDVSQLWEIIATDYVQHRRGQTLRLDSGPEWYQQFVAGLRSRYHDHHGTIEAMVAEGDLVATLGTSTGIHRGEMTTPWGATVPPTGKQITYTWTIVARIAGGKIAEEWWQIDSLSILQQLGAVPVPSQVSG
jgi:predicted ester cyclase